MSLFSYIDTRAPSTEEILKIETEYDENGVEVAPSWLDSYELQTEFSLQRLTSLFNSLSIIVVLFGIIASVWGSVRMAQGELSLYSVFVLLGGLLLTAIVFAGMRLARAWVSFMLVRLLQTEEE